MSIIWKRIPLTEAKAHYLYGVKNWLAVFAIGVLLGGLRELGSLNGEAHKAGLTITQLLAVDHPAIYFAKLSLGLNAGFVAVIYWLLLTKNPNFRLIASSLLIASWPLGVLIGIVSPFDGLGAALGLSLIPWMLSCAVWVTYLNRSRRVRVTFEHMVSETDTDTTSETKIHTIPTGALAFPENRPKVLEGPSSHPNSSVPSSSPAYTDSTFSNSDEDLWAKSLTEFESQTRNRGLWAKCFADASGNEAVAKAKYLSERTSQFRLAEETARHQRQQIETAEQERQAFRARLDAGRAELLDCMQFIRFNTTKTPIGVLKNMLRLLGGKIEWASTGGLNLSRMVVLNEHSIALHNDSELCKWILETALPLADSAFPSQPDTPPHGGCPSCQATIPLSAVSCLGCQAVFGVGSAWKPTPRSELERELKRRSR